ncbi:polyketide-8 synthase acyl carrier protein [Plantibacter flavus]|uniref:acyl carrier protein n=1 Tax=Plantibacter TaxID=190323 RepID=UPI0010C1C080|nr:MULTISPECIES: acyl carrier protein [Plantibacter]MBD8104625.1 acyl carrier protein [Plantibacter sp. CFBP 8775]MBD8536858.1 acyl carrier protein [Plantibacter sp. CFBP 13570]TKJ95883.1 polyketide-8 synthase acyl carrier protein [Plantibacter flavus]
MTTTIDREELRTLVATTLDIDVTEVTDTASFTDELDVDSLMALEVMVVLERRFQVKLDEHRLAEITSLLSAERLLREALEAGAAR